MAYSSSYNNSRASAYISNFDALLSDSDDDCDISYPRLGKSSTAQVANRSRHMRNFNNPQKSYVSQVSKKQQVSIEKKENPNAIHIGSKYRTAKMMKSSATTSTYSANDTHLRKFSKKNTTQVKSNGNGNGSYFDDFDYQKRRNEELVQEMRDAMSDDEFEEWFEYHQSENKELYSDYSDDEYDDDGYYNDVNNDAYDNNDEDEKYYENF